MLWFTLIIVPYALIILCGWYYLASKAGGELGDSQIPQNDLPIITVIVAARNEEEEIPKLISDLEVLEYPGNKTEIILVDDNSTDSTPEILDRASRKNSNINSISSDGSGKKAAIATAFKQARGDLIITTDSDCRVSSGWLQAYAEIYILHEADMIIGQVETLSQNGISNALKEIEFLSLQAITGGLAKAGYPVMCNGANLGFRKLVVKNYLQFTRESLRSGDDMFLLHSMKKADRKIVWLNNVNAIVRTSLPDSVSSFFNQRRRWASKSFHYRDIATILTGLATLIANLSIVAATILLFIIPGSWLLLILLFVFKMIPDILILKRYLSIRNKNRLLIWALPASILYPYYAFIAVILSLSGRKTW